MPIPKRSKSPRDSCSLAPEHLNALDFNRPNRDARLFLRKPCSWRADKRSSRRAVGAQLVGHKLVGRVALLLQQLPHEPQGRFVVPLGLDQQVQHLSFAIDGSLQVHTPALDRDHHLILSANWFGRGPTSVWRR